MAGANCVIHFDKPAAGNCSRCQKPYCLDCLDMETGQPICPECKKAKGHSEQAMPSPKPAASMPGLGGSPLNFKGRGLDDDPLGLLGGPSAPPKPKVEAPKPAPLPSDIPLMSPGLSMGLPTAHPVQPPKPNPVPPVTAPLGLNLPPTSPAPASSKPPLDLDELIQEPQPLRPPFPKAPITPGAPVSAPGPVPLPFPSPMPGMPVPTSKSKQKLGLAKAWVKFLVRRSYEVFDPLAKKLKVPTFVVIGVLVLILVGAVAGIVSILNRPVVPIAISIPPIHIVMVNSGQVPEMDITTFADLENQVQKMGFTPLIQMTIPQLPSSNFFDVGGKDDANTYSEILKMPGAITPHLSFVTVFSNGLWFSTNGWDGKNVSSDYQISEFYPTASPDDLYVKHKQEVDQFKQDKDWQPLPVNADRYMAAISDHLRWYLTDKNIQAYQADFKLWH